VLAQSGYQALSRGFSHVCRWSRKVSGSAGVGR
jgi:hypothetical protein